MTNQPGNEQVKCVVCRDAIIFSRDRWMHLDMTRRAHEATPKYLSPPPPEEHVERGVLESVRDYVRRLGIERGTGALTGCVAVTECRINAILGMVIAQIASITEVIVMPPSVKRVIDWI